MSSDPEILFTQEGALGHILLNRPKALNALTLDMALAMTKQLLAWADDASIQAVLVEGAGEKGFCAGGDIRALYDSGKAGTPYWYEFYSNEYRLDTLIHEFPKPFVALIDGITMGGGVGISINGQYRVATDRTVFAMPETGIGLIPDVGGSYFLPRLPGAMGMYLGLTGARLKAADCVKLGVATHYVPDVGLEDLVADLAAVEKSADVGDVLGRYSEGITEAPSDDIRQAVDQHFSHGSVVEIIASLEAADDEWSAKTLAGLKTKSPTSLLVTFEQLTRGKTLTFREGISQELRCVIRIRDGHDFFEGVRAVIVDKDNAPKWKPARIEDVDPDYVAEHFANLGDQKQTFLRNN